MFTSIQKRNLNTLDIIISIISFLCLITTLAIILVVSDEMVRNTFLFQFIILFMVNVNSIIKVKNYFQKEKTIQLKSIIKKELYSNAFNYNSLIKY